MIHDRVWRLAIAEPVGVELLAKSPGAALHVEATRKHAFGPHSAIDTVHHHLDDAIEIIAQGGIRATRALVGADDLGDAEPMAVAQRQQLPARGERERRLHFLDRKSTRLNSSH